ncbi:hypothetical protein DBV05_g11337 [Lasiodiplodia theobromae]|uniref:Protein NO VEIN C-terminal domain-containing protein n=1 Tax=Lasiodiplodia theobromae TaxID=45133 RepID=A0A5N5CX90_9PEZI|nr:hypothetical protein DBV05_g11337 [Lasiodiplodia theobromae]
MLVNAVQEMSTLQPPPVDQLKDIFMAISEMTPANEDLMRLRFTDFLPVQLLNGRTKLVKPSADFSVVDRTGYGEAFEGKAVLLKLSPTEVHSCRSLLVGLGLQDRLMSKAVEEITMAERGILNPRLTRNFQCKAYALFSGSSSLDMVDNILEKAGIVEVKGVCRPVDSDISDARLRADSALDTQTQQLPDRANGARPTPRQNTTSHTRANDADLTDSQNNERDNADDIISDWRRSLRTHSPGSQILESIEQPVENAAYAALLDRLIGTARNAYIPLCGAASHCFCSHTPELPVFNCSDYHVDYPSIFTMRSLDRDRRVGAAGELFVVELLRHLDLPNFSATANWLSTLRKEARVCNGYSTLEPWNGAETSDIVYHDTEGAFTAQLREKGYLEDRITDVTDNPTYYIEVKTTTRGCEEPLFMSGAQYARMQRMALMPGTPAAEVYVLVRVFNLEREDVGLRVYVDPDRYRLAGALAFSVDTWIVKPDVSQPLPGRIVDLS